MTAALLALIAPIFFIVSNYIDKHLVEIHFRDKSIHTLVAISAVIGFIIAPIFYILANGNIWTPSISEIFFAMMAGWVYLLALYPYLKSLQEEDTSLIVVLFQLIPLMVWGLGILFLNEHLAGQQVLAGFILILGALGISVDIKKLKFKTRIFFLSLLTSFLFALDSVLFKLSVATADYIVMTFWLQLGFVIAAIILLVFFPVVRKDLIEVKRKGRNIVSINVLNEVVAMIGFIIGSIAVALGLTAVVSFISNSVQSVYALIFGVILTYLPIKSIKEDVSIKTLAHKSIFIIIMAFGLFLLLK